MSKLNIAVIGTGWWATRNHIPALRESGKIDRLIIVDQQQDRIAAVNKRFDVVDIGYPNVEEMLNNENVHGAIISTPHIYHYIPAIKCLEKGINILVEKPMTTSVEDARHLVQMAQEKSAEIMVACGWNYTNYLYSAHQHIQEGRIGTIRHVVAQMASPTGDLFNGESLAGTENDLFRPPKSTWADPEKAGGYSWGQMSHLLAALFYLVDENPKSVFANFQLSSAGVDYYDAAVLKTDKGTTVSLSGASSMPADKGYMMDIRIFGSKGVLAIDIERERMEVIKNGDTGEENKMETGDGKYPGKAPVDRFVRLCAGENVHNPADAIVGLRSVEALHLMNKSAKSGHMETI